MLHNYFVNNSDSQLCLSCVTLFAALFDPLTPHKIKKLITGVTHKVFRGTTGHPGTLVENHWYIKRLDVTRTIVWLLK